MAKETVTKKPVAVTAVARQVFGNKAEGALVAAGRLIRGNQKKEDFEAIQSALRQALDHHQPIGLCLYALGIDEVRYRSWEVTAISLKPGLQALPAFDYNASSSVA